jgi:hypothetical protein
MSSTDTPSIQQPSPSAEIGRSWTTSVDHETVAKTIAALERRGIHAELVPDRKTALARLTELIPRGAQLMTGASKTLDEIGFLETLKTDAHGWRNVKAEVLAEKDPARQIELRKLSILSEYFVGSVHAVTQEGQVLAASAGGSQLAAYAYGADNVIWVVGIQKIVRSLDDALTRIREHSLPLEDQRMKSLGYPGSFLAKILIVEREDPRHSARLIFVDEPLGF